ncbi:glucosaminidase domain-containing protein [Dictyobacter arantiisoli]|uniref:Uncharacterized protein n=1 Tax=Dictyobacter arantiisoli TaxID=2014874 RepID=A0A5A5T6V0_9CHLR|nr:glucosaminidase domain-containing protein [Dictyobacter arantiisoli]GCF06699.1 hypothetical protein KDI_02630 [Dictyobacter arantiisoli]
MASGNYAKKPVQPTPAETRSQVPARATRRLSAAVAEPSEADTETFTFSREGASVQALSQTAAPARRTRKMDTTIEVAPVTKVANTTRTQPITETIRTKPGAKTTRMLQLQSEDIGATTQVLPESHNEHVTRMLVTPTAPKSVRTVDIGKAITHDVSLTHPLERHKPWMGPWLICLTFAIISLLVLILAGIFQRPMNVGYFGGGQTYNIQVGGAQSKDWQQTPPQPAKKIIKASTGPYSVIGKPTISVNFINQVLAHYHSPAAGKGQALYDLGVQYNIDPAFALAFFMHESSFGTAGEAQTTQSLGNLRCYDGATCIDQDRGGYAKYNSWEEGFKAWYSLINNYYVGVRGLDTVDKIIPTYAPTADNNFEAGYIAALKHAIDTWHAGTIEVN